MLFALALIWGASFLFIKIGLADMSADATATRDLARDGKTIPHQVVHETTRAVMTRFAAVKPTDAIAAALAVPVTTPATGV